MTYLSHYFSKEVHIEGWNNEIQDNHVYRVKYPQDGSSIFQDSTQIDMYNTKFEFFLSNTLINM